MPLRFSTARKKKRALYDFLGKDAALTMEIDRAIKNALEPDWKDNRQKQKKSGGQCIRS